MPLIKHNIYDNVFWFELFLEARAEILKKIVGFLVETITTKSPFEINWPLVRAWRVEKELGTSIDYVAKFDPTKR